MKILIINAGSSSMKYQLMDMTDESVIAKGNCERIGIGGKITHKTADGYKYEAEIELKNHTEAFNLIKKMLTEGEHAVIADMSEISAVGHRIVQGGAIFKHSVLVDEKVISDIESLCDLAPLHNPAHLEGIRACRSVLGTDVPEVVVFDTSFHQTMPPKAYLFNIPYEYYEKYAVRRYGFHGSSHRYVSAECAKMMGKPIEELKIITCHIGNGSSLAAIDGGKVVDTTMGLTPLDGFMMGTRSGTLDPSVVTYIAEKENLTPKQMSDMLNKKSGMLGVSGISSDSRDIENAAFIEKNERAQLTLDMQYYQIRKFIGSYIAALNGVDAIVFTGGLGENADDLRAHVCEDMSWFGIDIDFELNKVLRKGKGGELSTENSKVKVFVIPTDEEIVIARDTKAIVDALNK